MQTRIESNSRLSPYTSILIEGITTNRTTQTKEAVAINQRKRLVYLLNTMNSDVFRSAGVALRDNC